MNININKTKVMVVTEACRMPLVNIQFDNQAIEQIQRINIYKVHLLGIAGVQ